MSLRVASYNIHGGTDSERNPSLDQIITTLKEVDADVILLQEIDRLLPRSGFRDQFSIIADSLAVTYRSFYGRLSFGPCAFGNAILSRVPVLRWQRLPLPAPGGEPRAAIGALLDQGVAVWCTHLGLRQEWREMQLTALANAVNSLKVTDGNGTRLPTILGGDFNALRSEKEMAGLRERTDLTDFDEEDATFPSVRPLHRIDHLLARGVTRLNAGTREDRGSDHCLIWADFEWPLPPASHL
jgi:endonuclease/exonuclease/phosphatase family metal-dependent hydrolase